MRSRLIIAVASTAVVLSTTASNAVCIYHSKMYGKTTVDQEFADSKWVVHVKVLAADDASNEKESWTIYRLQVLTAYKGEPPVQMKMFTYRDSGGFYLDSGTSPDRGGEYLLFLDPISEVQTAPVSARQATEINYSCGQSRLWSAVSSNTEQHLLQLAANLHSAKLTRHMKPR